MSCVGIRQAMYLAVVARMAVGAASGAATNASAQRGAQLPPEAARAHTDPLDAWIDSVRRAHNIPALGAIVFRADTVLARGIAGVRRSNAAALAELSDRFQLGSNTKAITATLQMKWQTFGALARKGRAEAFDIDASGKRRILDSPP